MGSKDLKPRSSPVIIAPAQEKRELREAARELTDDALKTLAEICREGQSESARVAAANCLLDRGYGKPVQQVETGSAGEFDRMSDEELKAFVYGEEEQAQSQHAGSKSKH